MKYSSPIVLSSTIKMAANSAAVFDAQKLAAPNREAVAISEIRFLTGYPALAPPGYQAHSDDDRTGLGRELAVKIRVGPYDLCADFTPVWTMGPVFDRAKEDLSGVVGCYRWRLPRPLFVPPGTVFSVAARRSLIPALAGVGSGAAFGIGAPWAVPVTCTLIGGVVSGDFPRTTPIPSLLPWAPAPQPPATPAFQTVVTDMVNPLNQMVKLHYAIGRLGRITLGAGLPFSVDDAVEQRQANPLTARCKLTIGGFDVVPAGTEWNLAFDASRRTLMLAGLELGPGEGVGFRVECPSLAGLEPDYWAPAVTVVGSRKEVIS